MFCKVLPYVATHFNGACSFTMICILAICQEHDLHCNIQQARDDRLGWRIPDNSRICSLVMLIRHVFVDCAVHVLLGCLHSLEICLICCCCSYVACSVEGSDCIEGSEHGVY